MRARRWAANRTRDPDAVGAVVAGTALLFSTLYLWVWPEVATWVNGVPAVALVPLVTLNAFLVTKLIWSALVADAEPISEKRLAGIGLLIGLLSHVGLGFIAATAHLLFDENGLLVEGLPQLTAVPRLVAVWLGMSVLVGLYSTVLTFGVPFGLSIGISVLFARAHEAERSRTDR